MTHTEDTEHLEEVMELVKIRDEIRGWLETS